MLKIRVLEKTNFFPDFYSYRLVSEYSNVLVVSVGNYYSGNIEYFRLHLDDGKEATFNTEDYIMEIIEK